MPRLPKFTFNRASAALVVILLLGGFALFYQLDTLPRDLISDHVEYLLDVMRVQEGARDLYFGNNSGREPLFIYLAALVSSLSGSTSYLSLKVVSAGAAFLTLPLLYLLGREMDGRATGMFAAGIASVSLWTLVMERLGFRVMLAALAAALLLLAMWRALQTGNRCDFLLAGLTLGLGQYGYTSFRIAPLVALLGTGLRGWNLSGRDRRELLANTAALFGIALFALVPLLSYALRYPDVFWTRTNTLAGALDLDGLLHAWIDSLLMFYLGSDPVPLNLVQPGAPVLSPLVGALFLLGMLASVRRAWQKSDPRLLFAPLAFIVLVLPSALGAGSPLETPSARRAITALPAVMLLAGSGLSLLVKRLDRFSRPLAYALGGGALAFIAVTNLTNYATNYPANYHPPPARDIAEAIRRFEQAGGSQENIYLVYGTKGGWIDPRSIALWLGQLEMPHVLERVTHCPPDGGGPLMIILAPDDDTSRRQLAACFPQGWMTDTQTPEGDQFTLFFINAPFTR